MFESKSAMRYSRSIILRITTYLVVSLWLLVFVRSFFVSDFLLRRSVALGSKLPESRAMYFFYCNGSAWFVRIAPVQGYSTPSWKFVSRDSDAVRTQMQNGMIWSYRRRFAFPGAEFALGRGRPPQQIVTVKVHFFWIAGLIIAGTLLVRSC